MESVDEVIGKQVVKYRQTFGGKTPAFVCIEKDQALRLLKECGWSDKPWAQEWLRGADVNFRSNQPIKESLGGPTIVTVLVKQDFSSVLRLR